MKYVILCSLKILWCSRRHNQGALQINIDYVTSTLTSAINLITNKFFSRTDFFDVLIWNKAIKVKRLSAISPTQYKREMSPDGASTKIV